MSKQSKGTDKSTSAKPSVSRDVKLALLSAALSATLRLVIPVMGLFLLGLVVDALIGQTATWAVVGAVVGFLIAAFLIFRQIKKIQENEAAKALSKDEPSIPEKTTKKTSTKKSPEEKAD
ncbi:hypothetical protein FWG95_04715 [Candidatus Saccharibacteria bacterium]|nr:hypothetical protein [Candidatus Saccharibacteria bacterium]